MVPNQHPLDEDTGTPAPADSIVAVVIGDGTVVIYDDSKHTAWIKSDNAVTLPEIR